MEARKQTAWTLLPKMYEALGRDRDIRAYISYQLLNKKSPPSLRNLQQYTFIISASVGQECRAGLAGSSLSAVGSFQAAIEVLALGLS